MFYPAESMLVERKGGICLLSCDGTGRGASSHMKTVPLLAIHYAPRPFMGKHPIGCSKKGANSEKGTICGLSDLLDPGSEDLRDRVAGCDRSGRARHGRREVADPAQRRLQESRSRNRQRSIHPIFWGTESWRYTTDLPQVPCQPFMPFLPGIGLFVSLDFSVKPKSKPAGR